jgi:hypothetical protein
MRDATRRLWNEHNRHPGDRHRLFSAVAAAVEATSVLYPGSYLDIAASFVFPDVTYVDIDRRGPTFFADDEGVGEIIEAEAAPGVTRTWRFIHSDYTAELDIPDESVDLLLSLYAGFVSEACSRYLRSGGWLLVNPSHGDAAMASLDPGFELMAVLQSRSGTYSVHRDRLEEYLIPKHDEPVTKDGLHRTGRGVAYTKPAFAYVFRKV